MWKKQLAAIGLVLGLIASMIVPVPVYAGDINAAEQTIIDYYNGTVTYKGKVYRFTEEGKQKAYNKLISDDVDLTAAEAASAIRQANANLKQGIDEGYLVEVTDDGINTEVPDTEVSDTQTPDPEPDTQTPGNIPGDGSNTSGGSGESGAEEGGAFGTGGFLPADRPVYSDAKKTDVQGLLKDALGEGEYAKVNTGVVQDEDGKKKDWLVTVERFLNGTVDVVARDGSVILSAGLAIKNTGYYTGGLVLGAISFISISGLVLLVIALKKKKGYICMPVATAVAGIAAIAVFAGGFLESEAGKWNSVWILGSPEYTYAAERQEKGGADAGFGTWMPPVTGEQYGEILCDEIELRAPLYYGDTEEIFGQGAGTYTGAKLPGQGGEILIGGHDTTFFAPLEFVQKGMILSVKTGYGQYEYEVTGTKVEDVLKYKRREPDTEELVLYTCYPFGDKAELRNERFFVYAKKVSGQDIGE